MKLKETIQFIKNNWIVLFTKSNIIKFVKKLPLYILIVILLIVYAVYKLISRVIVVTYRFGYRLSYGIMKPCFRCTYQKSGEVILIFSKSRGPRIIMKKGNVYVRKGDCIGYNKCSKCFEAVEDNFNVPCEWIKI